MLEETAACWGQGLPCPPRDLTKARTQQAMSPKIQTVRDAAQNLKHRGPLESTYSTGLRLTENLIHVAVVTMLFFIAST
jgi:hypothetical protein